MELPEPTAELADELLVDRDWSSETVDLLREKKQILLYGPPGTGKTSPRRWPSSSPGRPTAPTGWSSSTPPTSYEDFFEGFPPRDHYRWRDDLPA